MIVAVSTSGVIDCAPREVRAGYAERFEAHCLATRTLALAAGCDYRRLSTATPYLHALSGFLVERIPYVETRDYVRIVQRNRALYRALYQWSDRLTP